MNRARFALVAGLLWFVPIVAAAANTIEAKLIPDGTYTVKVIQVMDAKHMLVALDNGAQSTLAAGRDTVDFTKIKASDRVKLSLIGGAVVVYVDMGP